MKFSMLFFLTISVLFLKINSLLDNVTLYFIVKLLTKGMRGGSGYSPLKSQWTGQVGGKESLLYFRCWQLWWQGVVDVCPKAHSHPVNQWARAFIDSKKGLHAETAQSALRVILKLVIGGLTSIIFIVLSTVTLQLQGWFVSISWGQFSQL